MDREEVLLVDWKIPPELWDRVFNKKAKYLSQGVTPNWIFFSTELAEEVPEIQRWRKVSGMKVHICQLPKGIDIMMVRLEDSE